MKVKVRHKVKVRRKVYGRTELPEKREDKKLTCCICAAVVTTRFESADRSWNIRHSCYKSSVRHSFWLGSKEEQHVIDIWKKLHMDHLRL